MPFDYDFSEELEKTLDKAFKKDRKKYEITIKKINEITSRDSKGIEAYKNLRNELSESKRVHVDKNFVLMFKVFKDKNFILFQKLEHHDKVYE